MRKLLKIAARLKQRGFNKLAEDIIDLFERRKKREQTKDKNQEIVDQIKEEDRLNDIFKQHQEDRKNFSLSTPEQTYPGLSEDDTRYEVKVAYPSFDQDGAPYFDQDSIRETLSMSSSELENHKFQEQQGYLKILSIEPQVSRVR